MERGWTTGLTPASFRELQNPTRAPEIAWLGHSASGPVTEPSRLKPTYVKNKNAEAMLLV